MKNTPLTLLAFGLVLLGGCSPTLKSWFQGGTGKPREAYSVLPKHESWCYNTLGEIDCYPGPQSGLVPESLVSVDPPSRYPLTREDYAKALRDYQAAQERE